MIRLGDKFKANFTENKILKVVKIYSPKMFIVKVGDTKRRIVCHNRFGNINMVFAHIPKIDTEMERQ